jgi:hypothetical protein
MASGFVNEHAGQEEIERIGAVRDPMLLVIDYAEGRTARAGVRGPSYLGARTRWRQAAYPQSPIPVAAVDPFTEVVDIDGTAIVGLDFHQAWPVRRRRSIEDQIDHACVGHTTPSLGPDAAASPLGG